MQEKIDFTLKEEDITDNFILTKCKTFRDALRECRNCSSLSDDEIIKEIKRITGIELDNGNFSKSLSGTAHRNFPNDLVEILEEVCGNWIPTRYLTLKKNQELRPKKEAIELELEQERAKSEELEKKLVYFEELIQKVKK